LGRYNALIRAQRPPPQQRGPGGFRHAAPPPPTEELKAHAAIARPRPAAENFLRAAVEQPELLAAYAEWIDRLAIADPELAAIRAALVTLHDAHEGHGAIDRETLSLHLTRSGQERAAARVLRWKDAAKPPGRKGREGQNTASGSPPNPSEWLALVTHQVVAPAIREELAELRERAAAGDDAAFTRFQALSREAREIEARAREAKLDDAPEDDAGHAGDLVA
jgi:hypothetical protein